MKNIVLFIFYANIIYANAVYDISKEEYRQYKENPKLMIERFKMKFFYPQENKISNIKNKIIEKIIEPIKIEKKKENKSKSTKVVVKRIKNIQSKTKNNKITEKVTIKVQKASLYDIDEVKNKLKYNTLLSENIPLLLESIEKILSRYNKGYDINEIKLVLSQIHDKKVFPFESKIYLNQIKNLLKGVH